MYVDSYPIPTLAPEQKGWDSLIHQERGKTDQAVCEVFRQYSARLEDPLFRTKDIRHSSDDTLLHVLKDLYMKYAITRDKEKRSNLMETACLLGFPLSIFDEVDNILLSGFDPYWKMTQHLAQYELQSKVEQAAFEKLFNGVSPGILKCRNRYPLLRYRLIYQLNLFRRDSRKDFSQRELRILFAKVQKRSIALLSPSSPRFDRKAYYFTLLKNHQLLRKKIPVLMALFDEKKGQGRALATTPDGICKGLLAEDADRYASALDGIRETVDAKLFPDFASEASDQLGSPLVLLTEKCEAAPYTTRGLEIVLKSLLANGPLPALSSKRLRHLLPAIVKHVHQTFSDSPAERMRTFQQIAHLLYRQLRTSEEYLSLANDLIFEITATARELEEARDSTEKTNVWRSFFDNTLSSLEIADLLFDLNEECVRLYRRVEPRDFHKGLRSFISGRSEEGISHSEKAPEEKQEVYTLPNFFNQISKLLIYSIVSAKNDKRAIRAAKNWIKLADSALSPPVVNTHLAYAILAGFNNATVARLQKPVLSKIGKTYAVILTRLENLFSHDGNFKTYKSFLNSCNNPTIPYSGFLVSELVSATEIDYPPEESPEQCAIIRNLIERFELTQTYLKICIPVKGARTDAVPFLYTFCGKHALPCPEDCEKIEWNGMTLDDQLYHCSTKRWPSPRQRTSSSPLPETPSE